MEKICCTIAILTHNSADTLPRALRSVEEFAEIIICDGSSIDETRDLARAVGARVIEQDPRFLSPQGRIVDFAGVRNQTLEAATQKWFLFLDSDEYLSEELAAEIRTITNKSESDAYWVPRKYVYQGRIVDCAVTYPTQQMRLFHRAVAGRFIKEVHERIQLLPGITPRYCTHVMLVPLIGTVEQTKEKWRGYLAIERTRLQDISFRRWLRGAVHETAIGTLYALRLVRIQVLCRGAKLPIRHELARIWYQWQFIKLSFSAVRFF